VSHKVVQIIITICEIRPLAMFWKLQHFVDNGQITITRRAAEILTTCTDYCSVKFWI